MTSFTSAYSFFERKTQGFVARASLGSRLFELGSFRSQLKSNSLDTSLKIVPFHFMYHLFVFICACFFLQREISLRMKLQSRSFRRLKFSPKKSLLSRLENSVHTHNDASLTLNFRRKHILTCSVQMLVQVSQSHVHSFPDSLLNDLFISLSLI